DNILSSLFHVIVRTDAHRLDPFLNTYHMFQRMTEFFRQPPMRYKDDTNHLIAPQRRMTSSSRQERALMTFWFWIATIRLGSRKSDSMCIFVTSSRMGVAAAIQSSTVRAQIQQFGALSCPACGG